MYGKTLLICYLATVRHKYNDDEEFPTSAYPSNNVVK